MLIRFNMRCSRLSAISRRFSSGPLVACLLLVGQPSYASECVEDSVRSLIDAIIDQQADKAQTMLKSIREAYPHYRLSDFYQATIDWGRGQFTTTAAMRKNARQEMLEAIEVLEEQVVLLPSLDNQFALGVAQGMAARMFIFDEQYLKAYRLGSAAKEHISTVYMADSQRHDARFFIGLFEYYTSAVPDELSWFSRLLDWQGDREGGVKHLEYAVTHSPTFAHEAARALLMEVNWQLPKVCDYLPLAEWLANKNIQNPYFSLTLQGVYLRCGQPEKALLYNEIQKYSEINTDEVVRANNKARLRALSQMGDVEAIKRQGLMHLIQKDRSNFWFALANAYDVIGMRDQAIQVYHKIEQMQDLPSHFKSMAQLRQAKAYHAPSRIEAINTLSIASACR